MPQISVVIPVYNGEKDLPVMLHSLQRQIYNDYEVIIVNDGSRDRTQQIAEEFAENDDRIRVLRQDNQGVSIARNYGLKEACGTYVVFFDSDDKVPQNALRKMLEAIRGRQADMAVGIMETVSDGKTEINKASKTLAKQPSISPKDPAFIKTWSQCNKMYRREFLLENNVRFLPVKVAEDGHFLYQALTCQPKICGCDAVVYQYVRRPFWAGLHTASKNADGSYLTDRLQVYGDMLDMTAKLMEDEPVEKQKVYRDMLITRFLRGGITQAFYRRIWRCDKEIQPELQQAVQRFLPMVTDACREDILKEEWDIPLSLIAEGAVTDAQDYFCAEPQISIIIAGLSPEHVSVFMQSMLNQEFPSFEVLVEEEIFDKADGAWKNMPNITAISKNLFACKTVSQAVRGRYICWIDRATIFPVHTFKRMTSLLEKEKELDFLSVYMNRICINGAQVEAAENVQLTSAEALFGPLKKSKNKFQQIDRLDNISANKMFRAAAVKNVPLRGMTAAELMKFYRTHSFRKIRSAWIMTDITDERLQERAEKKIGPCTMKLYAVRNRLIRRIGGSIRDKLRGKR